MKRRAALTLLILTPALARATLPEVTLLVELRWVDSALPPGAQAGVRDGAVVVGTAGAVSPRGPGTVTATSGAEPPPPLKLLVRNGGRGALRLTTRERLQWLDAVAELSPQGQVRSVYARPQPPERQAVRTVWVTPSWPGGRAAVRVAFGIDDDGNAIESTLDLPLARWQAVARSGGAVAAPARGTLDSRDAAGVPERELQLRVSVQPTP